MIIFICWENWIYSDKVLFHKFVLICSIQRMNVLNLFQMLMIFHPCFGSFQSQAMKSSLHRGGFPRWVRGRELKELEVKAHLNNSLSNEDLNSLETGNLPIRNVDSSQMRSSSESNLLFDALQNVTSTSPKFTNSKLNLSDFLKQPSF